jgi:hypothetical protein
VGVSKRPDEEDCLHRERIELVGSSRGDAIIMHLPFTYHVRNLDAGQDDSHFSASGSSVYRDTRDLSAFVFGERTHLIDARNKWRLTPGIQIQT